MWGEHVVQKPQGSHSKRSPCPARCRSELDLRKSGAPGRIIYDESYKYPSKEVRRLPSAPKRPSWGLFCSWGGAQAPPAGERACRHWRGLQKCLCYGFTLSTFKPLRFKGSFVP